MRLARLRNAREVKAYTVPGAWHSVTGEAPSVRTAEKAEEERGNATNCQPMARVKAHPAIAEQDTSCCSHAYTMHCRFQIARAGFLARRLYQDPIKH